MHSERANNLIDGPIPAAPANGVNFVVIAASAGGLAAITTILSALPPDFRAAVAVVMHRSPHPSTVLESLLGRSTALAVKSGDQGEKMRAGIGYIAPPNLHMVIADNDNLLLSDSPKIRFSRLVAACLFESAA
jgi:two-component system chemotaxis response regulator CheB